jgi:hypothetical protein
MEQYSNITIISAFLGALFYLLNIGTMQQFVVPFEMFTTLYAFLPWLFLFGTKYLFATNKKQQRLYLLVFSLLTFFAAPMAFAATLWYAHFFLFAIYILLIIWIPGQARNDISKQYNNIAIKQFATRIKRPLILVVATLLINSFWLLPNLYFIANHSQEVQQANINQLFSPQAFLYNKAYGDLGHVVRLKSFLFDWSVYTPTQAFDALLKPWISYTDALPIMILEYTFAAITLIGLIFGIKQKNKFALSLLPLLLITLFFSSMTTHQQALFTALFNTQSRYSKKPSASPTPNSLFTSSSYSQFSLLLG